MRIHPNSEHGAALILAVMMLSFLALVGGALLASVTLDAWVSLNYRTATQLLYLAESGIEEGRESLRTSLSTPSQQLAAAAGADGTLSVSRDPDALLASDDVPLLRVDGRTGRYALYLRNDAADGFASTIDSNGALTLVSIASSGPARKTLEVTVLKSGFPRLPAALTLDGSPASFAPAVSGFTVRGLDSSLAGDHGRAIGLITEPDRAAAVAAIPSGQASQYPGSGGFAPPPPDIAVIEAELDWRLKTTAGLERMVREARSVADEIVNPGWNHSAQLGNVGRPEVHRAVTVDGDCTLGPATGYGVLLVRGVLTFTGNVQWTGAILVIGQGEIRAADGGSVRIAGSVLAARTRDANRSASNALGTPLAERGPVTADFTRMGSGGIELDRAAESALNRTLPFRAIAVREY